MLAIELEDGRVLLDEFIVIPTFAVWWRRRGGSSRSLCSVTFKWGLWFAKFELKEGRIA